MKCRRIECSSIHRYFPHQISAVKSIPQDLKLLVNDTVKLVNFIKLKQLNIGTVHHVKI